MNYRNLNIYNRKYPAKDLYDIHDILKNKELIYNLKINDMLTRLVGMFEYKNLPDTVNADMMERYLFEFGKCAFIKHKENYYALFGNYGVNPDAYGVPQEFLIANPYLDLNKTYKDNVDCVVMLNDPFGLGLVDFILHPLALLTEGEITFYNLIVNARAMGVLSADDDTAVESVKEYFKALEAGDHHVIASTAFASESGIESRDPYNNTANVQSFIDLYQYIKSKLLADVGIHSGNNMKREYVSDGEHSTGDLYTTTLVDVMLKTRKDAVEKINELFGLSIEVSLSSAWEKQAEKIENDLNLMVENGDSDDPTEEIENEETEENEEDEEDKKEEDEEDKKEEEEENED